MMTKASKFGFVECADLVNDQKYGAALSLFQQAVGRFLESKSAPKRGEVARELLQIGTALEETLKRAIGDEWDKHIPKFEDVSKAASCSFCAKSQSEVRKLVAGPSVHICDECIVLCNNILAGETDSAETNKSKAKAQENGLCGICMEERESDELIFLPHAAYMCASCLEDLQTVRDKHGSS
jgi:hypothetical protein